MTAVEFVRKSGTEISQNNTKNVCVFEAKKCLAPIYGQCISSV